MNTKFSSIMLAGAVAMVLTSNAFALSDHDARARLDKIEKSDTRQAAHAVLTDLTKSGLPVDKALSVVESAVEHGYSASDVQEVGHEMVSQMEQGIPANYVADTADRAIDAGYSATEANKVLNDFQSKVENGMPADRAYVAVDQNIPRHDNSHDNRPNMDAISGHGFSAGMGAGSFGGGAGMGGGSSSFGGGAGAGAGQNMGGSGSGFGAGSAPSAGPSQGPAMGGF